MPNDPIVIVSAARTPMGAFQGELKQFSAPELGAAAIRAAVERAGIKPEQVLAIPLAVIVALVGESLPIPAREPVIDQQIQLEVHMRPVFGTSFPRIARAAHHGYRFTGLD